MLDRLAQLIAPPRRFALLAAAWLACFAWIRPPTVPDEGRYTDIARWMVLTGDWLIPRLDGLPFIQKPPLYFWLEAAAVAVAGNHLIVYRVTSIAAALLTVFVVQRFVRTRFDAHAARWSAIVLLTSPLFFGAGQFASLDMLVATCITCTVLFAVEAAQRADAGAGRLWLAAYTAAALGVLAKGLIGIVIPGLVVVVYALATQRPRLLLAALRLRGFIVLALIAVPWFVLVEQRMPGFLRYFFIHNHFERYAESGFNNPRGAWYYVALVLGGMLPWTLLLLRRPRAAWERATAGERQVILFGFVWSVVVVAFFSIPRSKLPGYILPALPPLAIVFGPWCARSKYRRPLLIAALVICAAAYPLSLRSSGLDPGRLASELRGEVRATDRVVFFRRYFFSVPLLLERRSPVEVVDDWNAPAAQLPDSWRRELAEGRDFEPARAAGVLVTRAEFAASLARDPAPVWIWVHQADLQAPELAGLHVVRRRGEYAVLRR
jgi:4-amino-4-deoxy-L-arabinose transferase-like glycosyltransferase